MPPPIVPVIKHRVTRAVLCSDLLRTLLSVDEKVLALSLGAVYHNGVRLFADRRLHPGDALWVYSEPRRFAAGEVCWQKSIVHEEEDFLVVNKPAGIPVHPTADNGVENVLHQIEAVIMRPLWICHRLDISTQGAMVLAKSEEYRKYFGRCLEERRVKKRYRALIERSLPPGQYTHYMLPADRAPRVVLREEKPHSKKCELWIHGVRSHVATQSFEADIELLTGRNHQLRAQLSALGAPILGDVLYGSSRPSQTPGVGEVIALQCYGIHLPASDEEKGVGIELPSPW